MRNVTKAFSKKTLTSKKNNYLIAFFMLMFLTNCTNTSKNNLESKNGNEPTGQIYKYADELPEYIGGMKAFGEFIKNNLTYPEWEKQQKIDGLVFVTFVVEADGSTSNFQVVRTPDGSKNLGNEALRVLNLMPKWTPGEIEGKKVRVSYALPVLFKLPKVKSSNLKQSRIYYKKQLARDFLAYSSHKF